MQPVSLNDIKEINLKLKQKIEKLYSVDEYKRYKAGRIYSSDGTDFAAEYNFAVKKELQDILREQEKKIDDQIYKLENQEKKVDELEKKLNDHLDLSKSRNKLNTELLTRLDEQCELNKSLCKRLFDLKTSTVGNRRR